MRIILRNNWPLILTIFVVVAALTTAIQSTPSFASVTGTFLGGFSSMIAFIWLIAGYKQQSKELADQREELKLQRKSLESQLLELQKNNKYVGMQHVQHIMSEAKANLDDGNLDIQSPQMLWKAVSEAGINTFKTMLESKDSQEVFNAYMKWVPIEGAAKSFMNSAIQALKIYFEENKIAYNRTTKTDEAFLFIHEPWYKQIPYLSNYSGVLSSLTMYFRSLDLRGVQLAGWTAIDMCSSKGVMKQEKLYDLYSTLKDENRLPEIAKVYKYEPPTSKDEKSQTS